MTHSMDHDKSVFWQLGHGPSAETQGVVDMRGVLKWRFDCN